MQSIAHFVSENGVWQTAYLLISLGIAIGLCLTVAQYRFKRGCYCLGCFREDLGWVVFLTLSWFVLLVAALLAMMLLAKDFLRCLLCRNAQHA